MSPGNRIATGGTGALGAAVVNAFLEADDRVVVPWIVAAEREHAAVARAAREPAVLVNGVCGFAAGALHEAGLDLLDRMWRPCCASSRATTARGGLVPV